ncbi:CDP-glycerol glycerophosphotransferase family protein [Vibrio splendidus]
MSKNVLYNLKKHLDKDTFVFKFVRSAYTIFRVSYQRTLSLIFNLFPLRGNKIIINNHAGQGYGDNAKYIVDGLLQTNNKYDIVWMVNHVAKDKAGLPNGIRSVESNSIKAIYERATAKLWIENNRVNESLFKRKDQIYIQTWHGGLGLKKIEGDAPYGMSDSYINFAKRDSKITDLYVSNSRHLSDIYKRAFWYDGEILECGYPKNDIFFSDKRLFRSKIRAKYNLTLDSKILLYAPTFREDDDVSAYNIDFLALKEYLNKCKSESWHIMIKLHPRLSGMDFKRIIGGNVIDATSYNDMQELVLGVDALVTDYSSCMFDSSLANVPTFIYASDISSYVKERGFYFSLYDLPFSVSENTKELIENIAMHDSATYESNLARFYGKVGLYDKGNAVEVLVSRINKYLANQN